MRVVRVLMASGLVWVIAVGFMVSPQARQVTDEDYDKLMKSVGAANGAMRKAMTTDQAAASAEAKKLVEAFKGVQAFWKQRNVADATDWAAAAMNHAAEVDKALVAKNAESAAAHAKELGGTCVTCHNKYREKTETGFAIKKQ